MLDNLKDYLLANTSPEMYDMFRNADEALKNNGDDNHEDGLEAILMADDTADSGQTQHEIFEEYGRLLRRNLGDYTVIMRDEATISQLTVVLNGINSIMKFDDPDMLLQTSTLDMGPQECLAELIALCAGENVDDLLTVIEVVSSALILRVRELATREEEELMPESERQQQKERAHALRMFNNFIDNNNLRTNALVANGVGVGFPYAVYANMIGRDFETMIPLRAAQEMIAMALISSDGAANPITVIKANLDKFIADVNAVTRIDIMVSDILIRMKR